MHGRKRAEFDPIQGILEFLPQVIKGGKQFNCPRASVCLMVGSENLTKFEVTLHRGYRDKGAVEKKLETIEAKDSEEAMEIALERTEGTSWRIDKIEEVK